jgi:hypothetical protein
MIESALTAKQFCKGSAACGDRECSDCGAVFARVQRLARVKGLGLQNSENKLIRMKFQDFQKVDQDFVSASIVSS